MSLVTPLDRSLKVLPADNGNIFDFGPGGASQAVGTIVLTFVPSLDFVGSFAVMARPSDQQAVTNSVGFTPFPYRRLVLNNTAQDGALVGDLIVGTSPSIIQVSANLSVGLLVNCEAGSCWVYLARLQGPSTI